MKSATSRIFKPRSCIRLRASALLRLTIGFALAASTVTATLADNLKKSGTVEIEQVQVAFIGSGNLGGGKLHFNGRTYDFTVGGLGIGGFGISKIEAYGTAYDLKDLSHFPGAYVQARYGLAIGSTSTGELWLKNPNGVVLQLKAKREGLALSLGGDAVYIKLD
jgi:hypothetical protein